MVSEASRPFMQPAPLPADEAQRLEALYRYRILDTDAEADYDDFTRLAAQICEAPIALVTLIDRERQWYKAHYGFDFSETSRDMGFCSHAILQSEPLVVNDALQDDRFAENPVVIGDPHVRRAHPVNRPLAHSRRRPIIDGRIQSQGQVGGRQFY